MLEFGPRARIESNRERAWGFLGALVLAERAVGESVTLGESSRTRRKKRALSIAFADRVLRDPRLAPELPGLFRELLGENPMAALTVLSVVRAAYAKDETGRSQDPYQGPSTSKARSRIALGLPVRGPILSPSSYQSA